MLLQDVSDLTVLVSSTPVKLQSCKGNTLKKKKVKTEKEKNAHNLEAEARRFLQGMRWVSYGSQNVPSAG